MGLAQGHNAVTRVMFDPATPCTLTLRCAPKISSEQNKIGQPASWHNTGKVVTACLYGRESRGAQGKKHYKLFFFNLYFILLSIFCYWIIALLICLFTQRTHMLTPYSIKWMGLRDIF